MYCQIKTNYDVWSASSIPDHSSREVARVLNNSCSSIDRKRQSCPAFDDVKDLPRHIC